MTTDAWDGESVLFAGEPWSGDSALAPSHETDSVLVPTEVVGPDAAASAPHGAATPPRAPARTVPTPARAHTAAQTAAPHRHEPEDSPAVGAWVPGDWVVPGAIASSLAAAAQPRQPAARRADKPSRRRPPSLVSSPSARPRERERDRSSSTSTPVAPSTDLEAPAFAEPPRARRKDGPGFTPARLVAWAGVVGVSAAVPLLGTVLMLGMIGDLLRPGRKDPSSLGTLAAAITGLVLAAIIHRGS